jgi:hypothetical protein
MTPDPGIMATGTTTSKTTDDPGAAIYSCTVALGDQ